jgi:hypothetical protein
MKHVRRDGRVEWGKRRPSRDPVWGPAGFPMRNGAPAVIHSTGTADWWENGRSGRRAGGWTLAANGLWSWSHPFSRRMRQQGRTT